MARPTFPTIPTSSCWPAALQEWLPDDHLASDVVDQLDLSDITARYEQERRGGPLTILG